MADPSKKFDKKRFVAWLRQNGHRILPTHKWEIVRFETSEGVGVVNEDRRGIPHFSEIAEIAYAFFLSGTPYTATVPSKAKRLSPNLYDKLRERDGDECFYCGQPMPIGEATVEHVLSRRHGGSDHIANLVLADKPCNEEAGHLSVAEKIKLRDTKRGLTVHANRLSIDIDQGNAFSLTLPANASVLDDPSLHSE